MEPTAEEKFDISIEEPSGLFQSHLNVPHNKRILFSSPFGTGKTYFLKKFFENSETYTCFHLFPVNYSVSTNEDIFELIKYDLLFKLLGTEVKFDHIEFGKWFTLESYIHFKPIDFFKSIFGLANKLGQTVSVAAGTKIIEAYESVSEEYKNHINDIEKDEKSDAILYLNAQIKKGTSVEEYDHISILIKGLLDQIKRTKKEVVLIIDDLDRIDPEHIFRLLNVFAAHLDINKEENKFGFNKVIFVCDEKNIRNIFHAKYGLNVDYTGYIDKFYSRNVYEFDNSASINKFLKSFLYAVNVPGENNQEDYVHYVYSLKQINLLHISARFVLSKLITSRALTIRSLERLFGATYPFERNTRSYSFIDDGTYDSQYDFIVLVNFLAFIFKGIGPLIVELDKANVAYPTMYVGDLSSGNNESVQRRLIIGNIIAMLDIENHKYKGFGYYDNKGKELKYTDSESGITFEYTLEMSNLNRAQSPKPAGINAYIKKAYINTDDYKVYSLEFFRLFSMAVKKLISYRL